MSQPLSKVIKKDPNAVLPYALDWTKWLVAESDAIAGTPTIIITPSGSLAVDVTKDITIAISPEVPGATVPGLVIFWLKSGTVGTLYTVTVRVTTSGGRTDDRSMTVLIVER